jgi:regulator of protease activity HflC (stomatin/prohibitin superfamily)
MNWLSGILSVFSAGASISAGQLNQRANRAAAEEAEINANMARKEAEADAARYAASARGFKAEQKVKFLKSGVTLEGSPLDILDETSRVASENISAIKAKGEAEFRKFSSQATQYRNAGRAAVLGGYAQAAGTMLGAVDRWRPSPAKAPSTTTRQSITGFGKDYDERYDAG